MYSCWICGEPIPKGQRIKVFFIGDGRAYHTPCMYAFTKLIVEDMLDFFKEVGNEYARS